VITKLTYSCLVITFLLLVNTANELVFLEELLEYNLSCLVITNYVVITTGTKEALSFIVDSLGGISAACSCLVITKNISTIMKNSANGLQITSQESGKSGLLCGKISIDKKFHMSTSNSGSQNQLSSLCFLYILICCKLEFRINSRILLYILQNSITESYFLNFSFSGLIKDILYLYKYIRRNTQQNILLCIMYIPT
jgi:hypothetical protein